QRVADPFALAVSADQPAPGAQLRLLAYGGNTVAGIDHAHGRDMMEGLRPAACRPIEKRAHALDMRPLQRRIRMEKIDLRATMVDRIAFLAHETARAIVEAEFGGRKVAGQYVDPIVLPRTRHLSPGERVPQPGPRARLISGAHVAGDACVAVAQQRGEQMAADKTGRAGEEDAARCA